MSEYKETLISFIYALVKDTGIDRDIIEYADLVDDLGMDSIEFISIVVSIEAMFDIIVPDEVLLIDNFRRVDDIVSIIIKLKTSENNESIEAQND